MPQIQTEHGALLQRTDQPERVAASTQNADQPQHTAQKIITFGIPCYNSAAYMDHCITSILEGSDYAKDVEIVIVDDGSTTDNTLQKALEWQQRYPDIIRATHQENGGHGIAVLTALSHASGAYFKVVDSDDWLDGAALKALLGRLRHFIEFNIRVDLVITNYVYEHTEDGTQTFVDYHVALPRAKIITWNKIGHFMLWQNLLMHSLCYRTEVLNDGGLPLPAHTFYVDNIYAYIPLPRCKTLYYLDVDLYRYFIGRSDQSVNEEIMVGRIDQQLRITRIMMYAYHLYDDVEPVALRNYMIGYLELMMAVCSIFSKLSDEPDSEENLENLWDDLRAYDHRMYMRMRHSVIGTVTNFRGRGEKVTIAIYRIARKVVKFN